MLVYLTDIFTHLNELSISLQGSNKNVVIARVKLASFKAKIPLCLRNNEKGNLARFPSLEEVVEEHESLLPEVATTIRIHLEQLLYAFDGYFSAGNLEASDRWTRNPFLFQLSDMPDEDHFKKGIIDMQNDHAAKMEFEAKTLENFWASQVTRFPNISKKALTVLVPFATTYLCEVGFSTLLYVKSKFRNRLDAQHDMRIALSKKEPHIPDIIAKKQEQMSHS
ncbi:protein ZBED8-like [Limulus polyphemus]|uniref:Protein ZBED8-like n=1 Tax=Limulus polyphemus TaxID=6850 RepID=A0ABM1B9F2_LIMPO|nr:protein ZBED8-like [Limulus polyphemus]